MTLGDMITIALRLFTHRDEVQATARDAFDVANRVQTLATKIAPELVAPYRATTPQQQYDVRWLQSSLNTLVHAGLEVDGVLGPMTKRAVEEFQQINGLIVDGWAGIATEAKILELLDRQRR